ncbi:MAG: FtsQ-type POTRA domain-containing protein [Alphaproteobacteria bacterium]|nr:FtsQ-type POTRA domain-containing protein [Alphaproteobacteria bacterium]
MSERKSRSRGAARQAQRPVRELPKVQPGTARRGKARKQSFFVRLMPSKAMIAIAVSGILLVLLLALAVTGALGRAFHGFKMAGETVSSDAGFAIRSIHISGERRTPAATIAAALDLHENQSIFGADLAAARARLMALDWVASAEVVRRYPDSISVTIVEKRPFALWQAPPDGGGNTRLAVVERNGGVITAQGAEDFSRLPKLIGAGAPAAAADLVDFVQSHRAIAARIAAYEYVSQRRWNLILTNGVIVKLPEQAWQKEVDVLEKLIIDRGILERDISEIDLRAPTHFFFLLHSGERKDEIRGKET